mgnify:CR=1 FL=1
MVEVSDEAVETYQRDGVVVLRGVFRDWVEPLLAGMADGPAIGKTK